MIEGVDGFQFCSTITPEDGITQADVDALAESYAGYTAPLDLQIGDLHAGGIVFQINENGSGLVAAMEDVPGNYEWELAVFQAQSFSSEGYTGWHLPSLEELELMYYTIGSDEWGNTEDNIGGFAPEKYWSSSSLLDLGETWYNYYEDEAWYVRFDNGIFSFYPKGNTHRVRVIRAF